MFKVAKNTRNLIMRPVWCGEGGGESNNVVGLVILWFYELRLNVYGDLGDLLETYIHTYCSILY